MTINPQLTKQYLLLETFYLLSIYSFFNIKIEFEKYNKNELRGLRKVIQI